MNDSERFFEKGYRYYCESMAAGYAAGTSTGTLDGQFEYIFQQNDQIGKLIEEINDLSETYRNNTPGSRQGFLFEAFHRKTYDLDRVVNHQAHLPEAAQPAMNGYASPDAVVDNIAYNAKVYADGHATFKDALSKTHRQVYNELNGRISEEQFKAERGITGSLDELKYKGQKHLVVSDQIDVIKGDARSAAKASANRGTFREKNYRDIQRNTVDRIEDQYGNRSIPISKSGLEDLDNLTLNKQLSPETLRAFGIDPSVTISWEQLKQQLINQTLKTGVTASVIAAVLSIIPIMINAISLLSEEGKFDHEAFCELGYQSLSIPAKSFLIGCSTSAVINASNFLKLKDAAKNAIEAKPLTGIQCSLIAVAVSILISTTEIAIMRAFGKISRAQMADRIFDCCLTSTLSILTGYVSQKVITHLVSAATQEAFDAIFTAIVSKVFGVTFTTALPVFSVLSYLAGSVIGFAIAKLIHCATKKIIFSFCVESGCTFFGIVDQNYELPQEVIDAIGIEVFDYEKFEYDSFQADSFQFDTFSPDTFEYEKFGIRILRRGVIEFGKIGYI